MSPQTKRLLKVLVVTVFVGALCLLGYEVFHWLTHVYESGARVRTEITNIAPRVDGTIAKIHVEEGQRVGARQLLVELEDEDIQLRIEALETDLALERAHRSRLVSEKTAFEIELGSKLETMREKIRAIEVEYQSIQDRLALSQKDLARVSKLVKRGTASAKELAVEQDKVLILRGESSKTAAEIAVARTELQQVESTRKQLDVIEEKIKISDLTIKKTQTIIAAEQVALERRHIRSPIDGIIDRVYKFAGEYVEEGENILILHDEKLFWLEAYVDEDQIRHVQVGQEVLIEFEAYPFEEFTGRIERIGSVTAAEMGVQSERGRGQFGRASERLPVRISIQSPPPNLAPGMLADVNVRITMRRIGVLR